LPSASISCPADRYRMPGVQVRQIGATCARGRAGEPQQ
jgi:hypothetical protein